MKKQLDFWARVAYSLEVIMNYETFLKEKNSLSLEQNVSRETFLRLESYVTMLKNASFNLISAGDGDQIWERHIFDSIQLYPYFSKGSVCDFGSGAGFPGIVLSALGIAPLTLVESIGKKAEFLQNVSRETFLDYKVICDRVENSTEKFDFITARAVASLKKLLQLTEPIRTHDTVCVFPKGKKYQEEIEDARREFSFDVEVHQSVTHTEGKILVLRNVRQQRCEGKNIGVKGAKVKDSTLEGSKENHAKMENFRGKDAKVKDVK